MKFFVYLCGVYLFKFLLIMKEVTFFVEHITGVKPDLFDEFCDIIEDLSDYETMSNLNFVFNL